MIRPATPKDIEDIVDLHLVCFPGFFLSFLGSGFLKLFYENVLSSPEGVLLISSTNNSIDGFVAGVTNQEGFYRRMIKRRLLSFACASLSATLRRPGIIPRLLRALRRQSEVRRASAPACLMSIGVRPEAQGKGIGRALVQAFSRAMAEKGVKRFCLFTDARNNDRVNRFYQLIGFHLVRRYSTPEGRLMNEYLLILEAEND